MNRREIFHAIVNHQQSERILIDFGKYFGSFHRNAYELMKTELGLETDAPGILPNLREQAHNWFEFTDYVIDRCSWDRMSATGLIVMIPIFILSITIRKNFVQGMTMEAVK